MWHVESGSEARRFGDVTENVIDLVLSPDGDRALTVSDDAFAGSAEAELAARLWDIRRGEEVLRFGNEKEPSDVVAYAPDGGGPTLAGVQDNAGRLWNVEGGRKVCHRKMGRHAATRVACAPDGLESLYGDGFGEADLLNFRRGHIVQRFGGRFGARKQSVSCLAFDLDGLLAHSGGLDGSVRLWDIESGK